MIFYKSQFHLDTMIELYATFYIFMKIVMLLNSHNVRSSSSLNLSLSFEQYFTLEDLFNNLP